MTNIVSCAFTAVSDLCVARISLHRQALFFFQVLGNRWQTRRWKQYCLGTTGCEKSHLSNCGMDVSILREMDFSGQQWLKAGNRPHRITIPCYYSSVKLEITKENCKYTYWPQDGAISFPYLEVMRVFYECVLKSQVVVLVFPALRYGWFEYGCRINEHILAIFPEAKTTSSFHADLKRTPRAHLHLILTLLNLHLSSLIKFFLTKVGLQFFRD